MTEDEARAHVANIAPEATPRLERYAAMVIAENAQQNLISRGSEAAIWSRHLLDSLQLVRFARPSDRTWLDVGSGAGLPGIVIAILNKWQITLVEPRRRRAEFLDKVVRDLGLDHVTIMPTEVRKVAGMFDIVSARAVAAAGDLFEMTRSCVDANTRYVLPKGQSASADVESAKSNWYAMFHVEPSLTDPLAGIIVADAVSAR